MIITDDVRRESAIGQQLGRFSWRSWTAVFRMRVLYETEAYCHRPEDVSSSLRGLPTLKELSATLRPGLHTPSTQTEGPLVRDDAEVAPSLFLSPFFALFLSLSLSFPSSYAFLFLCLYSPIPLLLFSLRCLWSAAWHASRTPPRPGHRRFSFDVPCDSRTPSFAASRVRFENYPETIIFRGDRAIHRACMRLDLGSSRGSLLRRHACSMTRFVLEHVITLLLVTRLSGNGASLSFDAPLTRTFSH